MLNAHGTGGRTPGKKYYQARGTDDRPHGEAFYGTSGALFSDRLGFEVYPEPKPATGPGSSGGGAAGAGFPMGRKEGSAEGATGLHLKKFIDCVRSRGKAAAGVGVWRCA